MSTIIRLPISNVLLQSDYTGEILIGASHTAVNVILDTGSSTLAVESLYFNPGDDSATTTTNIAQEVQYGSGSWVGAVVKTTATIPNTAGSPVALQNVNLAVTYTESSEMFGAAQGIWGLAYAPLDNAYQMPANSWTSQYDADRIEKGRPTDLDPYFSQLEQAGVVANLFAFYTKRSIMSSATSDPGGDPANQGIFVAGGGPECTDLYTGGFTDIAVLDDDWYNTNLLSVQVGTQAPITVTAPQPNSSNLTNSIVDSGTNSLLIDQTLFNRILASFNAINANFGQMLQQYSLAANAGADQTTLDLAEWPDIIFTLQGADGNPASLTVSPQNYWQFDASAAGTAIANIFGDGGRMGGQSILGLPLLNQYYTVFDRTQGSGNGIIRFATRV